MSMLFGGRSNAATPTQAMGLNLQTSVLGSVVPLCFGTVRRAGNLIWYGEFTATGQSDSGKGGVGGGGKGVTSYTYAASFIIALCEGGRNGIQGIGQVWVSKSIKTMAQLGFTLFNGAIGQAPWGHFIGKKGPKIFSANEAAMIPSAGPYTYQVSAYLAYVADKGVTFTTGGASLHNVASNPATGQYAVDISSGTYTFASADTGKEVQIKYTYTADVAYSGIAYVAAANHGLGQSSELPQYNFEEQSLLIYPGQQDALPSDVVSYLLTDPLAGAGFPSVRLDDLTLYADYCLGMGFFLSVGYNSQTDCASMISDIAEYTNSAIIRASGKLAIVPYGDVPVGNYVPPPVLPYNLGDDDFLEAPKLSRTRPSDAYNSITLEFENRANHYNTEPYEAKDSNAIALYGYRPDTSRTSHLFADKQTVVTAAHLLLQRQQVRNTYTFPVGWRYIIFDCMDKIPITDPALGLNQQVVRIIQMDEDDNGQLTLTVEEVLDGTGSTSVNRFDNPNGFFGDYGADSGSCNLPAIFEPQGQLVQDLEIWGAVSGGANWGGCDVYVSTDDSSYKMIGSIVGNARQGVLTSPLPAGGTSDTTNTLAVDLSESAGQLNSGTPLDLQLLNTLCWCDGEWMAYQTATLTSANQYNLTTLLRGQYGSSIGSHASGAQFARIDSQIFKYAYDASLIGKPVYFKFLGKNLYGQTVEDLATIGSYNYTPAGVGYNEPLGNPTNLMFSYYAGQARLTWTPVSDWRVIDYEIRLGPSWLMARYLDTVKACQCPYWGDGTYWVAAHFRTPAGLDIYSTAPASIVVTGGVIRGTLQAAYDEKAGGWTGTLTNIANVSGNVQLDGSAYTNGSYQIPAGHRINLGSVKTALVIIQYQVTGSAINDDVLSMANVLTVADMLGQVPGPNYNLTPQIRISQDGATWGPWQNYVPGQYIGWSFDARLLFYAYDTNTYTICTAFTFEVDL